MRMGHRRLAILVFAALLLGGLVAAPAAQADEMALMGFVYGTGYKFNMPLADCAVLIYDEAGDYTGYWDATDFTGWYLINSDIKGLPVYYTGYTAKAVQMWPGFDGVNLTPPLGWIPQYLDSADVPFSNASIIAGLNFQLQVNPTTFKGKVTRKGTKKGIRGVKVACAGLYVKTNSKGNYTLTGLLLKPGQKYGIKCTKKGYKTITKRFTALPGGVRTCNIAMRKK